jgi:hypothetical protein
MFALYLVLVHQISKVIVTKDVGKNYLVVILVQLNVILVVIVLKNHAKHKLELNVNVTIVKLMLIVELLINP